MKPGTCAVIDEDVESRLWPCKSKINMVGRFLDMKRLKWQDDYIN